MTLTWKHLAIAAGVSLALGGAGGYLVRPQPTVHRVETDDITTTRTTVVDVAASTSQASEQQKKEAGKTRVTTKYLPSACGQRQQIAERVVERTGPVTTNTLQNIATATESHAVAQEHVAEQRRLDLTITPPARPGWALQAGFEDVLAARPIRLELRRRLFAGAWVGIAAVPARRELGGTLSLEF